MRKTVSILLSTMLSMAAIGAAAPLVAGNHESSKFVVSGFVAAQHWIDLLSNCGGTIDYPENTLLFVSSGWGFAPWTKGPPEEKSAVMSRATTFTLLVDGEAQIQSRVYQYYREPDPLFGVPDLMAKLFNTEYHNGLTGSHLFTGQFYLDASLFGGSLGDPILVFECDTTVNFAA